MQTCDVRACFCCSEIVSGFLRLSADLPGSVRACVPGLCTLVSLSSPLLLTPWTRGQWVWSSTQPWPSAGFSTHLSENINSKCFTHTTQLHQPHRPNSLEVHCIFFVNLKYSFLLEIAGIYQQKETVCHISMIPTQTNGLPQSKDLPRAGGLDEMSHSRNDGHEPPQYLCHISHCNSLVAGSSVSYFHESHISQ